MYVILFFSHENHVFWWFSAKIFNAIDFIIKEEMKHVGYFLR